MTIRTTTRWAASAFLLFVGLSAATANADLLGVQFNTGTLYTVDPATGAASNPRPTGMTQPVGLTTRPGDGVIFGLTNAGMLYQVNPVTGATTTVGATGFSFIEADIAYDAATGFLFGIQEFGTGNYRTVRINPATAASTVVGTATGVSDLSAAAFAPDGTLYVIDTTNTGNSNLLTFNKLTGQVITTTQMNMDLNTTAGLAFDPQTGTAYVADGTASTTGSYNLYTLSLTTAALTTVGPTGVGGGLSGLTFTAIPEPASVAAIGVAFAALARRRRSAVFA